MENWLRVHFEDSAYTTVPATSVTTAGGICVTLLRKKGLPPSAAGQQPTYALFVTDAAHEHVFERRLADDERPLEVQEKSRKAGNLDHFRILFKPIPPLPVATPAGTLHSTGGGSAAAGGGGPSGGGGTGFSARGEAGMFDDDDAPMFQQAGGSLTTPATELNANSEEPDAFSSPGSHHPPPPLLHSSTQSSFAASSRSLLNPSISQQAMSLDPSILRCGYLEKRGKRNTAWKERWFALKQNGLHYYKSHQVGVPIATIPLVDAFVRACHAECQHPQPLPFIAAPSITNLTTSPGLPVPHAHSSLSKCSYEFEIHTVVRVFFLRAKSYPEMLNWIREIETVLPRCIENETLDELDVLIGDQEYAQSDLDDSRILALSSLGGVLANGIAVEQLVQFETERRSGGDRTVLAYLACEGWAKQAESGVKSKAQMLERAKGIWETFFGLQQQPDPPLSPTSAAAAAAAAAASSSVVHDCVSDAQRTELQRCLLAGDTPSMLFASVSGSLFSSLAEHSFPAFVRSKHFQRAALKLQMLGEQMDGNSASGGGGGSGFSGGGLVTPAMIRSTSGGSAQGGKDDGPLVTLPSQDVARARQATAFPESALPLGQPIVQPVERGGGGLGLDDEKKSRDTESTTTLTIARSEFTTSASSSHSLSSLGSGGGSSLKGSPSPSPPTPMVDTDHPPLDSSYSISGETPAGSGVAAIMTSGLLSGLYGVGSAAIGVVGALVPGSIDAEADSTTTPLSHGPLQGHEGGRNMSPSSLAAYLERVGEADAIKRSASIAGGSGGAGVGGNAGASTSGHDLSSPASRTADAKGSAAGALLHRHHHDHDDDGTTSDESGTEEPEEESIFDATPSEERSASFALFTSTSTTTTTSRRKAPVGLFDATPRTSVADLGASPVRRVEKTLSFESASASPPPSATKAVAASSTSSVSIRTSITVDSVSEEPGAPTTSDHAAGACDDEFFLAGRSRSVESACSTTSGGGGQATHGGHHLGSISELDVRSASNSTATHDTRPRQAEGSSASTVDEPAVESTPDGAPRVTNMTSRQPVESRRRSSAMIGAASSSSSSAATQSSTSKWKSQQPKSIFDDEDDDEETPPPGSKGSGAVSSLVSPSTTTTHPKTSPALSAAAGPPSAVPVSSIDLASLNLGEAVDVGDLNLDSEDPDMF